MKKILHIISQYPGKTGSGIYLNEFIKEASKKGYRQALVGAIEGEDYRNKLIRDEDLYLLKFNTEKLPFSIVGMSDEMPYRSEKYSDLSQNQVAVYVAEFEKTIRQAIEDFRPDIIFTHHLWLVSSLVKDLAGPIKVVGICHGTDLRQLKKDNHLYDYSSRVIKGCSRLDHVLSLNVSQKKEIENLYGIGRDRIEVIGGGYDKTVFYPSFEETDRIRIGYAGKLSYAKGIKEAIQAVDRVDKRHGIDFYLAGSGTGAQYEDIRERGLAASRKVEFIGELRPEEVGGFFRSLDIFLMPSYYEGLSLVTIEALASGLLVVSSRIEGLVSYLPKNLLESRLIEFVDLPVMEGLDKPLVSEVDAYIDRMKDGIEKQIDRLEDRRELYRAVEPEIKRMSWEDLFSRIEDRIIS